MKNSLLLMLFGALSMTVFGQERYLEEIFTNAEITIQKNVVYGINVDPLLNTSLLNPSYVGANAAQIMAEKDSLQNWIATNPANIPLAFFYPYSVDSSTILKITQLKMDVYMPSASADTLAERPVVMYIHTGNFLPPVVNGSYGGSKEDSSAVELCKQWAKRGFVAIAPNYRLGWNPLAVGPQGLVVRRATLLNAVYRAIHDVQYCVKGTRYAAANFGNPYGVDADNIAMYGAGSGGYVALAYNTLDKQAETALDKFVFGGNSVIQPSIVGDVEGNGGLINLYTDNGMSHDVDISVNAGGALGDISWMEAGDGPFVTFHSPYDNFAPFDTGIVIVPTTGDDVVDVNGPNTFMAKANGLGMNDAYAGDYPDDPFTDRARSFYGRSMANSPIININDPIDIPSTGMEGLFSLVVRDGNNDIEQNGTPWEWWSKSDLDALGAYLEGLGLGPFDEDAIHANALLTNPNQSRAQGLTYIDTIMGYSIPRMVKTMQIGNWESVDIDEFYIGRDDILAYPNPARDIVQLKMNNPVTQIEMISMYDLSGREVYRNANPANSVITVPTQDLKAGIYLVRVQLVKGKQLTTKVVITD